MAPNRQYSQLLPKNITKQIACYQKKSSRIKKKKRSYTSASKCYCIFCTITKQNWRVDLQVKMVLGGTGGFCMTRICLLESFSAILWSQEEREIMRERKKRDIALSEIIILEKCRSRLWQAKNLRNRNVTNFHVALSLHDPRQMVSFSFPRL